METMQQESTSSASVKGMINPYLNTYRLVYNPEWRKLSDKYEDMGMEVPEDCGISKYIKYPFSLNCAMLFTYFQDIEFPNCCVLEFEECDHLVELTYKQITDKILEIYNQ